MHLGGQAVLQGIKVGVNEQAGGTFRSLVDLGRWMILANDSAPIAIYLEILL